VTPIIIAFEGQGIDKLRGALRLSLGGGRVLRRAALIKGDALLLFPGKVRLTRGWKEARGVGVSERWKDRHHLEGVARGEPVTVLLLTRSGKASETCPPNTRIVPSGKKRKPVRGGGEKGSPGGRGKNRASS